MSRSLDVGGSDESEVLLINDTQVGSLQRLTHTDNFDEIPLP